MNVQCPQCWSMYRVDPARVPPAGVRARCSRCGEVFAVQPPGASRGAATHRAAGSIAGGAVAAGFRGGAAPAGPAAPEMPRRPASPAGVAAPPSSPGLSRRAEPPVGEPAARAAGARPVEPGPAAAAAAPPRPAPGGGARTGGVSRSAARAAASDPDERARRIARALVSDIVVYHKERCERSLQMGTLRTEFKEEILKSWDEYVEQVGLELARATPYFRDALNEILAKGQKVF